METGTPRVIKEIIKKRRNDLPINFPYSILGEFPIGVEGIYTDMFSGLNLEEELRIGGNKETEIEYGDDFITITDKYFLLSDENKSYYKLETKIYNAINRFLVNPGDFLVSESDNSFLVFTENIKDLEDNLIEITLSAVYKNEYGDFINETIKQHKFIIFSREDNKIKIVEQLDKGENE